LDKIDAVIINMRGQRKSLREIARAVGISHIAVKKRLDRMEAERGTDPKTITFDDQGKANVSEYPDIRESVNEIDRQLKIIARRINQPEFRIVSPMGWEVRVNYKASMVNTVNGGGSNKEGGTKQ